MFLLDQAEPQSRAFYDPGTARWTSYGELGGVVSALAGRFHSRSKRLAFLFVRNDAITIACWLALVEAGQAVALLDDALNPAMKQDLIDLYEPDLIVYSNPGIALPETFTALYRSAESLRPGAFVLWRTACDGEAIHPDLAVLLSTSGSTGSPKFVRLTRRNLESNAEAICRALAIGSADCAIMSLPFHYSYGLSILTTHLLRGAALAPTVESVITPGFWNTFRAASCTSLAGVPYTYEILHKRLKLHDLNVPTLRTMTQAGGKLDDALTLAFHEKMAARGGRFFTMYGQTEASPRIAVLPWDRLPGKLGSAGKAIPGGTMFIGRDGGLTTDPGCSGELVYRGPNVMMGYAAERSDLARGDELHGELRTGDLATLDSEGFAFIAGRMNREAKLFGLRVNLDEVESMLKSFGPAAVVDAGGKLSIYCEYGCAEEFAEQRKYLSMALRIHASAFDFHRIGSLPLSSNGKIDYPKLRGAA
jgi:acyl-CoA synthetase (AMP-forming)/AMP-acid ligase II